MGRHGFSEIVETFGIRRNLSKFVDVLFLNLMSLRDRSYGKLVNIMYIDSFKIWYHPLAIKHGKNVLFMYRLHIQTAVEFGD